MLNSAADGGTELGNCIVGNDLQHVPPIMTCRMHCIFQSPTSYVSRSEAALSVSTIAVSLRQSPAPDQPAIATDPPLC